MGALLDEAAAVDDEDDIGGEDGGEAVRDGDRGPSVEQRLERGLHETLAGGVEGRGGLVEDEDAG